MVAVTTRSVPFSWSLSKPLPQRFCRAATCTLGSQTSTLGLMYTPFSVCWVSQKYPWVYSPAGSEVVPILHPLARITFRSKVVAVTTRSVPFSSYVYPWVSTSTHGGRQVVPVV